MAASASSFPEFSVRAWASEGLSTAETILAEVPHKPTGNTQLRVARWDAFQDHVTHWCLTKTILYHL